MPLRKRSNISLLIPFLVVALVFGLLIWQRYRASRQTITPPHIQQPSGLHTAVLFFVADGTSLAREARQLDPCEDAEACAREVLEELFYGPVGELDDAFPEGAVPQDVHFSGNTAVVDLDRAFADQMPSGSSAEMMAVYSIVNTLCVNFPQITQVKLNIGGAHLKHLDLSAPLAPDYSLERRAEPASTVPDAAKEHT
ncbi:GerMN domain-containing protein [Geobacter sp. SVR]|uniref:GerMN domain-containing protein n=1 Tax=Geobacter sp. SVR TaxID=2495594 RepID=UPI00143F0305|nr:GerMN domain-containing protein [Geobacter sp. SVR]BCS54888.1 sporulation protein [Geobacter sp. SVR]GCF87406.1 sporulation protein [Geobacter sp. SVR]